MNFKIYILILILFFNFCNCCTINKSILECASNIESCQFSVSNIVENTQTRQYKFDNKTHQIDLMDLDEGMVFLMSLYDCQVNSDPYIKSMDIAPVNGGKVNFKGAFLFDRFGTSKKIMVSNDKLDFTYDSNSRNYTFNCPPGCGTFNITYNDYLIYNGKYKNATFNSSSIENKINVIFSGTDLASPTLTINGTNHTTPYNINNILYSSLSNVTFKVNEIKYCGKWTLNFYSCGMWLNNFEILNMPKIYQMNSVDSSYGGNVTIGGINLYSRSLDNENDLYSGYNISVYSNEGKYLMKCQVIDFDFKNENIICFMPPSSGVKRNLKLFLTIDNEFKTSTNFSYNSPSISDVNQINFPSQGNAEFKINGKYLNDKLIAMVLVKVPIYFKNNNTHTFKDYQCKIINSTESEMIVQVPLFAYPGYIVIVTNDGLDLVYSNIGDLKLKPIVNSVTKSKTSGEIITISGVSLHTKKIVDGNKYENLKVTINALDDKQIKCKHPISYDGVNIECLMDEGVGKNLPLEVNINEFKGVLSFSYKEPKIADVKKTIQNSKTNITSLPGENLGIHLNKISVTSGKLELKVVKVNHTCVDFLLPNEMNDIHNLTIKVGSLNHEYKIGYEFVVKPIILNITSIPLKGGKVTISGVHLSSLANIAFRSPRNEPSSIKCLNSSVNQDHTKLFCNVKGVSTASLLENDAGEAKLTSGSKLKIYMTLKGREAKNENNVTFSFEPPVIYGTSGKDGLGSGLITISGDNFNKKRLYVWIGDRECKYPNIEYGFDTITCKLDKINNEDRSIYENKTFNIIVEVDGQRAILNNNFTYTFKEPITHDESNKMIWVAPAIGICGTICLVTISAIGIHKYQRYRRIKKIKKILNKPNVYINRDKINNL